ncbi:MAG: hypothetical protein EOO92_13465 [Pedobacter sp.]|nr:MAG: hypothetical protein EOO92_13465 [Pedobacter sp.]
MKNINTIDILKIFNETYEGNGYLITSSRNFEIEVRVPDKVSLGDATEIIYQNTQKVVNRLSVKYLKVIVSHELDFFQRAFEKENVRVA